MRVREDNCNMVLLASVALVCAVIALAAAAFEPSPSTARSANQQAALADETPVRIVGVPFVPNTNPGEHR
jgi:acid phosphatase class B